jgi:Ran GTPase-activating protein (RanGAP) involved in mRNA processing and transport
MTTFTVNVKIMSGYTHPFTFTQEETRIVTIQNIKALIQGLAEFDKPAVSRQQLVLQFKNQDSTKHRKRQSYEVYKNNRTLHSCGLMSGVLLELVVEPKPEPIDFDTDDSEHIKELCGKNNVEGIREFLLAHKGMLNLSHSDVSLQAFGTAMEGNDTITHLQFTNNDDKGFVNILAKSLFDNTTLAVLDISKNELDRTDRIYGIIPLLTHNHNLTSLNLYDCCIQGGEGFAAALKGNTTLTSLNLGRNNFILNDTMLIVDALHHNSSITEFDFQQNNIGNAGAIMFAEMLRANPYIISLNLRFNDIKNIEPLATVLHINQTLRKLDLGANMFGNTDAEFMAQAIINNFSLTYVSLACNVIHNVGAFKLAQALETNRSIRYLNLNDNKIDTIGREAFAQVQATVFL